MKKVICKTGGISELTADKEYEVISEDENWYRVINDYGINDKLKKRYFKETTEIEKYTVQEVLNLPDETIVKMITEEGYDSQLIKVINQYDTKCLIFKVTGKYVPITEIWLNVKYEIVKSC